MNNRQTILGIISLFFVLSACTHEPDLSEYPEVSFSTEVQPIITANCTQSGCHGDGNHSRFPLTSYEDVLDKVEPFNAHKSELYRAITGKTEEIMPPSGLMPDEQIGKIFIWIEQGAKNN